MCHLMKDGKLLVLKDWMALSGSERVLSCQLTGKENLVLDLNRIRDQDFTYVNGKLVGSMESTEPRKYTISKNMLTPGRNVIAIQVLNYFDKGGISWL